MKDDKRIITESIDALMEELRQVVREGEKLTDREWMFSYILAELSAIFKEGRDVSVCELWRDVRLP